jgi:hypothetical protein
LLLQKGQGRYVLVVNQLFKNWSPMQKYLTFEIHKSKFVVIEWHFAKVNKTYNYSVFFINLGNNSWTNYFLERKIILGHKCILNLFNQLFFTNYKGRWFLTIKKTQVFQKLFLLQIIFLERFLCSKKIGYGTKRNIWSFLEW